MTVTLPDVGDVRSAVQVAIPMVEVAASVQGEPVKLPTDCEKVRVPVGVIGLPAEALSVTVAVQVEACPMTIGLLQATVVVVVRRFTVTVALTIEALLLWTESEDA